jgi:hypothetical protein
MSIHTRLDRETNIDSVVKDALDSLPMQDVDFKKFGASFTLLEQSFSFWFNQLNDLNYTMR